MNPGARIHLLAAVLLGTALLGDPQRTIAATPPIHYRTVDLDGVSVFYCEAGPRGAPAILLLHGFPLSSFMYRNLIPALADRYRVVAPDYPAFGYSDFPDRQGFRYSFDAYVRLMDRFVRRIGLDRHALYVQDCGAPIGLRLALLAPERITALIVQNGNAYEEGLRSDWDPLKAHWRNPTSEGREQLRGWLTRDGIRLQ